MGRRKRSLSLRAWLLVIFVCALLLQNWRASRIRERLDELRGLDTEVEALVQILIAERRPDRNGYDAVEAEVRARFKDRLDRFAYPDPDALFQDLRRRYGSKVPDRALLD